MKYVSPPTFAQELNKMRNEERVDKNAQNEGKEKLSKENKLKLARN
jgi:hypothetical protein